MKNKQKEICYYLYKKEISKEELEGKFNKEEIIKMSMINLLILKNGKYSFTELGESLFESLYKKPTFIEKIKGYYYHYILGY